MALAIALAVVLGGTIATYVYDEDMPLGMRVPAGAATGLAVLGLAGFTLASHLGLGPSSIELSTIVLLTPLVALASPRFRRHVHKDLSDAVRTVRGACFGMVRRGIGPAAYCVLGVALVVAVFRTAVYVRPDGIYTGDSNNFGDLPLHLAIVSQFVHGEGYPPEHPEYAGTRLAYPFLADFVVAMLVAAGETLQRAFLVEAPHKNLWVVSGRGRLPRQ